MPGGPRLASRVAAGDGRLARCSAGVAHPSGHQSARGGTVRTEATDAANSPLGEARVYLVADTAGCAPAAHEWLLHGGVSHQDATYAKIAKPNQTKERR